MIKIPGFILDDRENNTTHCGALYYKNIKVPCANKGYQSRKLRLWIPDNFDFNKEYGVLYMSDGQNAVDESITYAGEWNLEDHFKTLVEEGYPEFIIVGLDCPRNAKERMLEYLPGKVSKGKKQGLNKNYGTIFSAFFVDKIVGLINKTFKINGDLVGFCGSSMGGLISFYICSKYPEVFKFCISFSPAFSFYTDKELETNFKERNFNQDKDPKYVFFMGGADPLERELTPATEFIVNCFKDTNYDDTHLIYIKDETRIHHESTWSDYIEQALRFVLSEYKNR